MNHDNHPLGEDEAATRRFLRGDAGFKDLSDPANRRVASAWHALGEHASAPEMMALRHRALARAGRAAGGRWGHLQAGWRGRLAVAAALVLAVGCAFLLWTRPADVPHELQAFETSIAEQRSVELTDRTRVAMDAETKLQVDYSRDARVVRLQGGQAFFAVAKEARRPFRIEAGDHTIVAVGTAFNVEYGPDALRVTMQEGRVTVSSAGRAGRDAAEQASGRELVAGEELRVDEQGSVQVIHGADIAASTAWRQGKVIFTAEPLRDAVRRMNRYSSLQIEIADQVAGSLEVSGVFETGDSLRFAQALRDILPLAVESGSAGRIVLRADPRAEIPE